MIQPYSSKQAFPNDVESSTKNTTKWRGKKYRRTLKEQCQWNSVKRNLAVKVVKQRVYAIVVEKKLVTNKWPICKRDDSPISFPTPTREDKVTWKRNSPLPDGNRTKIFFSDLSKTLELDMTSFGARCAVNFFSSAQWNPCNRDSTRILESWDSDGKYLVLSNIRCTDSSSLFLRKNSVAAQITFHLAV